MHKGFVALHPKSETIATNMAQLAGELLTGSSIIQNYLQAETCTLQCKAGQEPC